MDLPAEVFIWWEALFAVALHAPIEELERIAAGLCASGGMPECSGKRLSHVPDNKGLERLNRITAEITQKAIRQEQAERKKKEAEEQDYLKELQRRAEAAAVSKREAEMNLARHRNPGGNNV